MSLTEGESLLLQLVATGAHLLRVIAGVSAADPVSLPVQGSLDQMCPPHRVLGVEAVGGGLDQKILSGPGEHMQRHKKSLII